MKKTPRPESRHRIHAHRIGIYAGEGSSQSFLWLVDLFEKTGLSRVRIIDEYDILEKPLDFDFMIFSGGAPAQMAEAIGKAGAEKVHEFISQGGRYIGICAGTCLPLHSKKEPLSYFNWIRMPIANMSDKPPPPRAMEWKYMTPYGDDFVYHPVREDITIAPSSGAPAFFNRPVTAPLYGGPPLMPEESEPVEQWGRFAGFSKNTLFLADEDVARKVVLDRAAVVQVPMGKGSFILFSPHLEHPRYPSANRVFLQAVLNCEPREQSVPHKTEYHEPESVPESLIIDLRRTLSNCRVRVSGLIPLSIRWQIGQKLYEPEKAFEFLDAVWKRLPAKNANRTWPPGAETGLETILARAREAEALLRTLAEKTRDREDTTETAGKCFNTLRRMTREFLNIDNNGVRPLP